ncbi:hypothetical protein C1646_748556 [Rhizophagus diaphanus]|nr:hypothetical protein C1646_748556 [Rhizophagus diaphanus] [Rhizophagus sp. MUCL 43196]
MEENFDLIYRTSFENNTFSELQKYCTDLISKEPAKIFKSPNISSIPENLLISIIQNDYLQMNEVQIWEQLIKWGLAQHPELPSDFTNYSKDDFKTLKNTLQQCIPFIRFYNLSSKEFTDNVLPYRKLLPKDLYEDLLKTFLTLSDPNSKPENKSRPRITNDIKLNLPNYENDSDQVENNKSMVNMTSYNWKVTEEDSKKREELRKSKDILKEKLNKLRHSMLKNPAEEQSKWWEVVTEEPKKWEEPTEEQNNWLEEEWEKPIKWEKLTEEQNEWREPTEKWVKSAKSPNEKWVKPSKSPNEKWVKSAKNPNEKWVKSAKNPNEKWVSTKTWVKPTVEKPKRPRLNNDELPTVASFPYNKKETKESEYWEHPTTSLKTKRCEELERPEVPKLDDWGEFRPWNIEELKKPEEPEKLEPKNTEEPWYTDEIKKPQPKNIEEPWYTDEIKKPEPENIEEPWYTDEIKKPQPKNTEEPWYTEESKPEEQKKAEDWKVHENWEIKKEKFSLFTRRSRK